ncbi:MAG: hypothetical protein LBP23_09595 [Treponema sp.]|jgi:hypothetical protein|nr:hypothetical protein [Treponema sp.]
MKRRCCRYFVFSVILPVAALLFLRACGDLTEARSVLVMPEIPPSWTALLGNPRWKIEYLSAGGIRETFESGGEHPEIFLHPFTASAISAWPFWPDRGIRPGLFRPAGALYPFDMSGSTLMLSWQGGVEAFFYWELASAAQKEVPSSPAAALRRPQNFDWPRFRLLLSDPSIPETVRLDPWTADWRSIAEGVVRSGFNQRRIVPARTDLVPVPVGEGPWFGISPFAAPWRSGSGETPLFPVGLETASYFSTAGILRVNRDAWMLLPWPAQNAAGVLGLEFHGGGAI